MMSLFELPDGNGRDSGIAGWENMGMGFKLRYDMRCYFNVRSKADMSRLNLPHGNDN